MNDVVASEPRRGRGWWVVAAVAVAALVAGALRQGGGSREASPSPSPTAPVATSTPVVDPPESPAPRLSAPPGPPVHVVAVDDTVISRDRLVLHRTASELRIDSFVPLRGGYAAVVIEDPQQSANPAVLFVSDRGRKRTFAVDEETRVVPGATAESFWTTRTGGPSQRRDAGGDVVATERVPMPYRVVAGTVAGLLVSDDEARTVGLWRGGRVDVLARDAAYATATATHAAWLTKSCLVACDVVVRDLRAGGGTWTLPPPLRGVPLSEVRLNPRGDAVATLTVSTGGSFVHVARRGGTPALVAETADFDRLSHYAVDWVDDDRVAVFDVRDDAKAFVYDLRSRRLTSAGTYPVGNVPALYADPPSG